ncbi:hypothetical protein AJ80_03456 [Polytolypa hystricis UAMH7299]|uniref:Uncharacterized protein n=1 Tax=Polytolypa hystricis (strain UAMH7299) TaxID=1447883 RepID=A0A2B7YI88_POLH7|nr:hypothetical protein AJ80_03456 [Polytolypa hystricis UAMH7299]
MPRERQMARKAQTTHQHTSPAHKPTMSPTNPKASASIESGPESSRTTTTRSTKRKRTQDAVTTSGSVPTDELSAQAKSTPQSTRKRRKTQDESPTVQKSERRLRIFRKHPPQSFLVKLERARTQRMYVLKRTRGGTDEEPEETVGIVGTTGNIYQVVISKQPSCTCPDARKGNQCKHVVYVLYNVLKVAEHLQYQLAFLSSELREIFQNAPISPIDSASTENESAGKRKPIDGDCPICFMELDAASDDIVWCHAACGNNVHKGCFQQWAASSRASGGVRCVYCRTPWKEDCSRMDTLLETGIVNEEGYINVAESFGLSGERDYSTYHQPWARRRYYGSYQYYYD